MLTVCPYHPGDADQALRMFRWIFEFEGRQMPHDLLLIADSRCSPFTANAIHAAAAESFRSVTTLAFVDHFHKWPDAPNAVFAFAARHIMANQRVPWLFLEPDCCPLKAGWLDAIEAEYKAAGKPFLGARVEVNDVPLHMSGNGVYPVDAFTHYGLALIAGDVAWDVAAASQIVPQAHFTKLILHNWKHPPFSNQSEVDNLLASNPETVLFHSDKSGSLIELLRERKQFANTEPNPVSASLAVAKQGEASEGPERTGHKPLMRNPSADGPSRQAVLPATPLPVASVPEGTALVPGSRVGASERDGQFICDILIKSYPPDYERLAYCLRSIEKFASGFRQVILIVPHTGMDGGIWPPGMGNAFQRILTVEERGEGYLFQQTVKASAHEYTDADYVLHLDSDTILTKPVTPETFFRDGKPLWLMTPYAHIQAGIEAEKAKDASFHCGALTWKLVTEKFMVQPVEYEFMRRMPMFVPRSVHVAAAGFCHIWHKQSLTDYILSQPNKEFSEFNALGALAYSRARDDFYWLDTTKEPLPEVVAIQKWSHEPFTDETKAEFEAILKGDSTENKINEQRIHGGANATSDNPNGRDSVLDSDCVRQQGLTPWQSPLDAITEIRSLAERLKKFCTGGAHTRKVREELHALGIVELPYRMRKRKGWRKRRKATST